MEYVEGRSLDEEIKQCKYLPVERAVEVCSNVAVAIQAAHDIGILHRDIKPGNVLLDKRGNGKLADFGLAHLGESAPQLTKTGVLLGTPAYMSPEQASGAELDTRSDVYGLGCVLYESLTGSAPFRGTTHQVLKQIEEDAPVSMLKLNENIPKPLHVVCCMAMAKKSENRYQSAEDFRLDLSAASKGEPIMARPETKLQLVARWYRKNKKVTWLSGAIAALLLLTTVVALVSASQIATENRKAVQASQQSEKLAAEATEQRTLAIETLNGLVFDIQNKLKGKPGTIKVKQAILENALKGLEEVVAKGNELTVDHSVCTAYLRMADIELARGNDESSTNYYKRAEAIARKICERFPGEIKGKINLGYALLGLTDLKATNFQFEEAIKGYTEVSEIRRAIVETEPSVENQFDYARSLGRLGSIFTNTGKSLEALHKYQQSMEIMEAFPGEIAEAPVFARSYVVASGGLATQLILNNKIDMALDVIEDSSATLDRLLELEPNNPEYLLDTIVVLGQRIQIYTQKYDWPNANKFAIECRKVHQRIVESNPGNDWSRSNLGLAWGTEAQTEFALNNIDAAQTAWQLGYGMQKMVLENNPTNLRFIVPAAEAAGYLAGVALRKSDLEEALEYSNQSNALLAQLSEEQISSNPMIQRAATIGNGLARSIESAILFLDDESKELSSTTDIQKYSVAMVSYQKSLSNDRESVLELLGMIQRKPFESQLFQEYVNFTMAASFSNLLNFAISNKEPDTEQLKFVELAIENLDRFMTAPPYLYYVELDPDFRNLRKTESFTEAKKKWMAPK